MTQALLTQAWTVTPNVRNTYASLNDMMSWWIYNNHVAIKAKWTLKWTSDGTTGPANAGDNTDRLTDKTKCATRGANAASAQSYAVYSNADGVQMLITYQGATDDVCRISYSKDDGFTLAGTTTNQPTAADEVVNSASQIGNGTSLDRVMSIWVRDDGKAWSCATFRSGTLQSLLGVEKVTSLATVRVTNPIYSVPYVLYRYTTLTRGTTAGLPTGGAASNAATVAGAQARVYTDSERTITLGGGELLVAAAAGSITGNIMQVDKPAAQNGAATPLLPIFWSGPKAANTDGFFAQPIDWWQGIASSTAIPAQADPFPGYDPGDDTNGAARSNWLMALGSCVVRPWRNAAATMETS